MTDALIEIDTVYKLIYIDKRPVELTLGEWAVMGTLVQCGPGFVDMDTIILQSRTASHDSAKHHIVRLRQKLGYETIITRRGFGYRFATTPVAYKGEE